MDKEGMLQLLRNDVVPALGCTEPVCVALAAADAARAAGGEPVGARVVASGNIVKNGFSVGIPGFDRVGLEYAAALGALIARPELGLEIFQGITDEIRARAIELVEAGHVTVEVYARRRGVYVNVAVRTTESAGSCVIEGTHTNITLSASDGSATEHAVARGAWAENGRETLVADEAASQEPAAQPAAASSQPTIQELFDQLVACSVAQIRALAASATADELAFLADGVAMNEALAAYGMRENPGIGISTTLDAALGEGIMGSGVMERVMVAVASAIEARLEGCPYPTMSSAGSGSKGIATILPVVQTARAVGASEERTLQALAFAHLLNEYVNLHVGKLSAVCACSMGSATAASAAITWLLGGDDEQIGLAIRNMSGTITGMICDGGKTGCACKLSCAISGAFTCALLARNGVGLRPSDGICADTPEGCIRNMGRVSQQGMVATDTTILDIMLEKQAG